MGDSGNEICLHLVNFFFYSDIPNQDHRTDTGII